MPVRPKILERFSALHITGKRLNPDNKNRLGSSKAILLVSLLLCSFSTTMVVSADEPETFSLSGNVYDANGLIAGSTSIKVGSSSSIWSDAEGNYVFEGISPGTHTVRAYFMNNGHSVVYRSMNFQSDMQLDWYAESNWITAEFADANGNVITNSTSTSTVELIEEQQFLSPVNGNLESDLLPIGDYYTLKATHQGLEEQSQYVHFQMQAGVANHFTFQDGENSAYGFLTDTKGNPLIGITVSNGVVECVTNDDGFFLFHRLAIGTNQTFSFTKNNHEIIPEHNFTMTYGQVWVNFSSDIELLLPGPAYFTNSEQTIGIEPHLIEWVSGNWTNSYHLYLDDELLYTGVNTDYEFTPESQGSYDFKLVSFNQNGSTESPDLLLLIVLGDAVNEDLWSVGMSWDYQIAYTPASDNGMHNVSITALEKETLIDAFGEEQTVFKTRHKDEYHLPGEKSYRWYDTTNLLPVQTYWRDAPLESSYYMEGQLGWNFSTSDGSTPTTLFSEYDECDLHFNRTNVIGVPGHPDGYDDTMNRVTQSLAEITTPAGTFQTTHYSILDLDDNIVSWELWYNETVRNFVKKIDRLPGSHSEQVVYELTSFDVPTTPQFITEATEVPTTDYTIEWSEFQGASSYVLSADGLVIYDGVETTFEFTDQSDGAYVYSLVARMQNGFQTEATELEFKVFQIVTPPVASLSATQSAEGESVTLSWVEEANAAWYAVRVENAQGETSEVYNGTSSTCVLDELEPGMNRIRVQVGLENGKVSEASDSVFVTVEAMEEDQGVTFFSILFIIALIGVFGWMMSSTIGD